MPATDAPPAPPPAAPATPALATPPPPPQKASEALRAKLESITSEPGLKDAPIKRATTPDAPKPPAKPAEVKPPETKPESKVEPPPGDKPPEKTTPDGKPKKPSDYLREELAKQKARAEALEAEVTKFKTTKPVEDPEKKAIAEKLAKTEARAKEIEDELRFTNYERSPEFKEKYVEPYHKAWARAARDLEQTRVPNSDGTFRKANKDDLMKIMNLGVQDAGELAEQLFGKAEAVMMRHRDSILSTWEAQQEALAEGRKMAEQREQEFTAQQTRQQSELRKLQAELRVSKEADFVKRHPELEILKDDKGQPVDKEIADILERDRSVTDNLFNDDSKLSPDKKLELHAEMRNRAAHFGTMLKIARKAVAELAELKTKLAQYEDSEPVPGDGAKEVLPELQGAMNMKALMSKVAGIAREK